MEVEEELADEDVFVEVGCEVVEVVEVEGVGTEITQHQGLSDMQMWVGVIGNIKLKQVISRYYNNVPAPV